MQYVRYFLIFLGATAIGALTGMGCFFGKVPLSGGAFIGWNKGCTRSKSQGQNESRDIFKGDAGIMIIL